MSLFGFLQLALSTVIFLLAATMAKSWALAPGIGKLVLTLLLYSAGNLIMLGWCASSAWPLPSACRR